MALQHLNELPGITVPNVDTRVWQKRKRRIKRGRRLRLTSWALRIGIAKREKEKVYTLASACNETLLHTAKAGANNDVPLLVPGILSDHLFLLNVPEMQFLQGVSNGSTNQTKQDEEEEGSVHLTQGSPIQNNHPLRTPVML